MVTAREKWMIGGALLIGGVGVVTSYLILPTYDNIMKSMGQIAQKEASIMTLQANLAGMEKQVKNLKKLNSIIPEDLIVRSFRPHAFQENIKIMVGQLVDFSTSNGNDLISLSPWVAPEIPPPPQKLDANGNPIGPKKPSLKSFGYELVVRGSYDSVLGFIGSLNEHNELIEIKEIKMENEAGEDRSSDSSDTTNPFKPIKLTTKLILYLQPKG